MSDTTGAAGDADSTVDSTNGHAVGNDSGSPIRWIQGDLGRTETLSALRTGGFPPITHILYAPSPDGRTPEDYARVYPLGLRALLAALGHAGQIQRCVLVDSTAVWGPVATRGQSPHNRKSADDWVNEDTPTQPADFRGASMLEAEAILHARLPGRAVALRLSGLYGPGRLRLIEGLRVGRIRAPDGSGHWANRIHVDDAARACTHLLTLADPLPCYIGTDDAPMPTAELYEALARLAGCPPPVRQTQAPRSKRLSNARLRASGWAPQWPRALDGYAACLTAEPD